MIALTQLSHYSPRPVPQGQDDRGVRWGGCIVQAAGHPSASSPDFSETPSLPNNITNFIHVATAIVVLCMIPFAVLSFIPSLAIPSCAACLLLPFSLIGYLFSQFYSLAQSTTPSQSRSCYCYFAEVGFSVTCLVIAIIFGLSSFTVFQLALQLPVYLDAICTLPHWAQPSRQSTSQGFFEPCMLTSIVRRLARFKSALWTLQCYRTTFFSNVRNRSLT
jgi:hypothetical protein